MPKEAKPKRKPSRSYIEGCRDCAKTVPRWIVITESATSFHVARYHTEVAARSYYEALDNHMGTPFCLSRTLTRLVEHETSFERDLR